MSTAENADWSYARREAVIARLNGTNVNLDKLKDEDLNKLFADILKVRRSRTGTSVASTDRPESRTSFLDSVTEDGVDDDDDDDDESGGSPSTRPYSGSTWSTGPTSVGDSTLTLSGPHEVEERLQAVKEERIKTMIESSAEVGDVKAEKEQMEVKLKSLETQMRVQKQRYETRVKRLKASPADDDAIFDLTPLTPEQERLARFTLVRWRRRRRVRMAEDALSQAVTIKEANVISRELKKGVSFQFVVVEDEVPTSASEAISGLADFEDVSDAALSAALKPCIGVKVLDRRNQAIYVWSLPKLQQRLQQMRNLYKFIDKPECSQHFSWEDPFYESPPLPGGYSFVGKSLVSLAPLSRNLPSTSTLPIHSPYTADPIGSCRVRIKPISVTTPEQPSASLGNGSPHGNGSHPSVSPFVEGSKLDFEIVVDQVSGLTKAEFTSAHLQIHLSTFFGPSLLSDETLPSAAIDLETSGTTELKLRRTLTVGLTKEIQRFLREGYAPVEFFARIKPAHLDKIELWDEARDSSAASKVPNTPSLRGDPTVDVTRRPETELISEQRHDVMASVELRELGETGEYVPVQVVSLNGLDSGAFFLRQGLQRRFVLKLSHNSGRGWQWKRISKVSLGNVRMLDDRGRVHAAPAAADVELRPSSRSRAVFGADGTATLSFAAPWDLDSPFLNRNTASNHRALLRLTWEVEADNCATPVVFTIDIAVTVQGRDARAPSKLMSILSSTRLSSRITSLFAIRLTPFMTKKPTDVWRLNTADTYVRGEEVLATWKPRGMSLVRDHDQLAVTEKRVADVEAARAVLDAFELTLPSPSEGVTTFERLSRAIELWQKHFGEKGEVRRAGLAVRISG